MPDAAISGLTAVNTPADADVLAMVSGGITTKVSLNQLTTYFEQRARQNNASVAVQTLTAADTYLIGSNCFVPTGRLQAKSMYRARFSVVKTAAGVAAPQIIVRAGTAATTADASVGTTTFAAQTAVVDEGLFEIFCAFRTVGAAAVLQTVSHLTHRLPATGLSIENAPVELVTSAAFNSAAITQIGVSVVAGTAASWSVSLVQAELFNLA